VLLLLLLLVAVMTVVIIAPYCTIVHCLKGVTVMIYDPMILLCANDGFARSIFLIL